ncbi:MAG: hypothetical protein IKD07_02510, partial [Clostridia bacterium]|nr:hypothetical protein [Clostridia bacterium]
PINSFATGFTPFRTGVFEDPQSPDYSEFEGAVHSILSSCPEAVIFPRIYISMPKWWTEGHPDDVIPTNKGGYREVLFSEAFRKDASELLIRLIAHIQASDYASRVGGWQICGGQTQEWFHYDQNGSLHPAAEKPYREWAEETYGIRNASLPHAKDFLYTGSAYNECENARRYSVFCNLGVAETVDYFAKAVKRQTKYEQIVGAFYGYAFESNGTVLFGTHALRRLLTSPNLDFFSSPNAYTQNREFGMDWADMIPVDSVKHHGKLCFIECDIRTHLTKSIQEARPNVYPDDMYRTKDGASVWVGPPTAELSREALRKSFAHQLTKASAIWWFDMWGGWYDDPLLMQELAEMKVIYHTERINRKTSLSPEVVFFADEQGYSSLFSQSPHLDAIPNIRTAMGNTGVPYDSHMVEDADSVLKHYKAAVFPMPIASEAGKRAMALCEKMNIPYLTASATHYGLSVEELKAFYKRSEIHIYSEENDVVYVGNGFLALHSAIGGEKRLRLPVPKCVTPVFGAERLERTGNCLIFMLKPNATALFSIE